MTAAFAAALSEHPLATQAVGEVVGSVLEKLGAEPDLAVLFVTGPHVGALEDVAGAVRAMLRPATLLGATAVSVVGGRREVERHLSGEPVGGALRPQGPCGRRCGSTSWPRATACGWWASPTTWAPRTRCCS